MHGPNALRVDTLEQIFQAVPGTFAVPSILHQVWAFQGKSLLAVTSMSALLTVPTVSVEGSVEPAQAGRCTCLTAGLLSGLGLCTRIRTAGHAETGTASKVTQRCWTVDLSQSHSDGRRSSPMAEGSIPWMYSGECQSSVPSSARSGHLTALLHGTAGQRRFYCPALQAMICSGQTTITFVLTLSRHRRARCLNQ
jgi:hypothetical protein